MKLLLLFVDDVLIPAPKVVRHQNVDDVTEPVDGKFKIHLHVLVHVHVHVHVA